MNWRLVALSEAHARQISKWQYPGEYAMYNCLPWEQMVRKKCGIVDAKKREEEFQGVVDERGELVGYFRLMKNEKALLLGLGLAPAWCGQGYGKLFLELIKEYVQKTYPEESLQLEVRKFNQRARKCYEEAGFRITEEYVRQTPTGEGSFYRMAYQGKT